MSQNLIVKPAMAQPLFSLNMPSVDELFPGFAPGDFAVIYGSPSVTSLASMLCVRAQLSVEDGGSVWQIFYKSEQGDVSQRLCLISGSYTKSRQSAQEGSNLLFNAHGQ